MQIPGQSSMQLNSPPNCARNLVLRRFQRPPRSGAPTACGTHEIPKLPDAQLSALGRRAMLAVLRWPKGSEGVALVVNIWARSLLVLLKNTRLSISPLDEDTV